MLALPCFMLNACGDDDVTTDVPEDVPEVVKPVDQTSDGRWFDGILYYRKTSDGSQSREVMVTECKQETVIVEIPSFVEYDGIKYSVTRIGEKSFEECDDLRSVTIPNSVRIIEKEAFCECHLTSVTIPNSVTTIEEMAFCDCQGLTSITIPSSVTSIGSYAFYWCNGLTSVTIGNSVKSIGDYAFDNCRLTDVTCLAKIPPTLDYQSFSGCDNLHILPGCKAAYEGSNWKSYFKDIVEDAKE